MKVRILITVLFLFPLVGFGQLYYNPITNVDEKSKLYYINKVGDVSTINMKKKLRYLMKDIPYKTIPKQSYVSPRNYLVTNKNIYFLNPDNMLAISRKGKILQNLKEPTKVLFDSTVYGRYHITTAQGGDCEGNPNRGIFLVPCREYVFYVTGQKLICLNRKKLEVEEEFHFKDFRNKGKYPLVHYFFESVNFRVEIKGRFK